MADIPEFTETVPHYSDLAEDEAGNSLRGFHVPSK